MRNVWPALLLLPVLLWCAGASADPTDETGEAALQLAVERSDHPAANVALGLHAAREGRPGWAILHLERARLATPLDRETEQALELVRQENRRQQLGDEGLSRLTGGEPRGMFPVRLLHSLPVALVAWLLLLATWLTGGLGAAMSLSRRGFKRDLFAAAMWAGLVICGLLVTKLVLAPVALERAAPGVIVQPGPLARSAPDELSRQRSPAALYEGALVRILGEHGGWSHVELADGETVWIRRSAVAGITEEERRYRP